MAQVYEPTMLNSTGQRIADALEQAFGTSGSGKVSSITNTEIVSNSIIEVVGDPDYVDDVFAYPGFNLSEPGYYVFGRVVAKNGVVVTGDEIVEGADGCILTNGNGYIDIAVKFDDIAVTKKVVIHWGPYSDTIYFKATDFAVKNLKKNVTVNVSDLDTCITWDYELTTDTVFQEGKRYFFRTVDDDFEDAYQETSVVYGLTVDSDTYYTHTNGIIDGLKLNSNYRCDALVDCPIQIRLSEVDPDISYAKMELWLRHSGDYSITIIKPTSGIDISGNEIIQGTNGINIIKLEYIRFGSNSVWRVTNQHSDYIPTPPALSNILVWTQPSITSYSVGDTVVLNGMTVVAIYDDGSMRNVTTNCTFTPQQNVQLTINDTEIVVAYSENDVLVTTIVPIVVSE